MMKQDWPTSPCCYAIWALLWTLNSIFSNSVSDSKYFCCCCCCFFPFPAISELYITVQVLPHKHNTHNNMSLMFKYYQCSYSVQCFFLFWKFEERKKERKMSLLLVKCFLSLVFLTVTLLSICYQLTVHSYSQKKKKDKSPRFFSVWISSFSFLCNT